MHLIGGTFRVTVRMVEEAAVDVVVAVVTVEAMAAEVK
jgi:hypothetical protein